MPHGALTVAYNWVLADLWYRPVVARYGGFVRVLGHGLTLRRKMGFQISKKIDKSGSKLWSPYVPSNERIYFAIWRPQHQSTTHPACFYEISFFFEDTIDGNRKRLVEDVWWLDWWSLLKLSIGSPWSDLCVQKLEVRGLEKYFKSEMCWIKISRDDDLGFDCIHLLIWSNRMLRPNLLFSGVISWGYHGGIPCPTVAPPTRNAKGVNTIKKHESCPMEGRDIRALVCGALTEFKYTIDLDSVITH